VFITNHALAGAVVGHVVRRPAAAFVAGAASHVVMDVCLHYGRDDVTRHDFVKLARVDGVVGLGVCAVALATARGPVRPAVAAGIAGACVIDMDKPGRHFFGRSPFPAVVDRFHVWIQTEHTVGALVEAAAATALAAAVVTKVRRARGPHPS
jgi:hypothetical protein